MNTQPSLFSVTQAPVIDFRGQLHACDAIKDFALAGNATLTVRSVGTGNRFTFRIRTPKVQRNPNAPVWFVSLLGGSDNESDYRYVGMIHADGSYRHGGEKAKVKADAPSAVAFNWFWKVVQANRNDVLTKAEVWHEGRCGRCGRKLTVPESIAFGFGPECAKRA